MTELRGIISLLFTQTKHVHSLWLLGFFFLYFLKEPGCKVSMKQVVNRGELYIELLYSKSKSPLE